MQKKIMVAAFVAVTALILAMPVAADSNTKTSTAGIYANDVDYFINYHKWGNVFKDSGKWFGYVAGSSSAAELGYAATFGDGLYLGAQYKGYIVGIDDLGNDNYHVTRTLTPTYNAMDVLTQTEDKITYNYEKNLNSNNNFLFLIGVAKQGIKVGFSEEYKTDLNPGARGRDIIVTDYQDGRKDYTGATVKYQKEYGTLTPSLGWGTNIDISGANLMPYVDLSFAIHNDLIIDNHETYTSVNDTKQNIQGTVDNGHNNGKLTPSIKIGANIDLPKKGSTVTQLQLGYSVNFDLYSNDYSGSGFSDGSPVNGTVSWGGGGQYVDRVTNTANSTVTSTNLTLNINEATSMKNTVTPGYKVIGEPFDNFKLGFAATVPVTFDFTTGNSYSRQIQKSDTKYTGGLQQNTVSNMETFNYNDKDDTTELGLSLTLALGAQYKLIPDRFTINAGISATPLSYSYKTEKTIPNSVTSVSTTVTKQEDGDITANTKTVNFNPNNKDEVEVTDSWGAWKASVAGGFVFNFGPNAALDLGIVSSLQNSFNLNLTDVNVIFTFKF